MRVATEQRESTDERHSSSQPPARLGGTDLFRGAMVILAAVVIGGIVLSRGLDGDTTETDAPVAEDEQAAIDPAAGQTTDGGGAGETTDQPLAGAATDPAAGVDQSADATTEVTAPTEDAMAPSSTDTTVSPIEAIRPPAEVRTIVLNAGGPQGIAGRATELLQAASYTTAAATNADVNGPSVIYYTEGYQEEALAVASVFGPGLDGLVRPLDPASPPTADMQQAAVVVVVGNDDVIAVP